MNWKPLCLSAFLASTITCSALANQPKTIATIPAGLKQLISHPKAEALQNINLGIIVQNMKTGKIIYQHHANHLFTPASIQK